MLDSSIALYDGQWFVGSYEDGYTIAGNYDDGYTVWRTADGEDSETLYAHQSFERCLVWCINS